MYITLEDGERPETPNAEHHFKPNGVCADCVARNDLPTLPLRLQQTSGGYKAIEDAEGRRVTFVAMREDDRAWGEFLLNRVNNFDALYEALQYVSEVSERQAAKDADDSDTANMTVTIGWLREVKDALALVDGPTKEQQ